MESTISVCQPQARIDGKLLAGERHYGGDHVPDGLDRVLLRGSARSASPVAQWQPPSTTCWTLGRSSRGTAAMATEEANAVSGYWMSVTAIPSGWRTSRVNAAEEAGRTADSEGAAVADRNQLARERIKPPILIDASGIRS